MTNIINYSPNMMKTFEECPQKFFFRYIKKLSVPQRTKLFEKGKKIHALANYYLNGEDIEKMEKTLNPDEKATWELLKSSKYFALNVVNTEYNLSCKIDKYWIGGRLDAFMSDESGINPSNYFILDYKTGKIPPNARQDFQTIVYLLCADRFLKNKYKDENGYESLKFVYLGLKNDVEEEILLTDELKKQYEEKIILMCEKINFSISSHVFQKNKEGCKHCEYCKLCEVAE